MEQGLEILVFNQDLVSTLFYSATLMYWHLLVQFLSPSPTGSCYVVRIPDWPLT